MGVAYEKLLGEIQSVDFYSKKKPWLYGKRRGEKRKGRGRREKRKREGGREKERKEGRTGGRKKKRRKELVNESSFIHVKIK